MSALFDNKRNFNADISGWDTSRVTNMASMFLVRCSPPPPPKSVVAPSRLHAALACMLRAHRNRSPRSTSRARSPPRAPCALLVTLASPRRPSTSRLAGTRPASRTCTACFTCAAPRPAPPKSVVAPSRLCMLRAHRNRSPRSASCGPQPAPRTVCPACRPSPVRDGLQPAAQLGHVPRHEHGLNVLRALLPAPASQICSRALSPVHAARAPQSLAAFRLLWPAARPAHRVPCLRPSAVRDGLQPAAQLGHLPRHEHVRHVLRALLPAPAPPKSVVAPSAARRARSPPRPPPGPAPAPRPCHRAAPRPCCARTAIARRVPPPVARSPPRAPCALLATLASPRRPSTSRSAGTRPASRTWTACFTCAAPRPRLPNL